MITVLENIAKVTIDKFLGFIKSELSYRFFYFLLYLFLSVLVFSMYIKDPGINGYHTVMYGDMIYGKAHKPFVSRILLPGATRVVSSLIPESTKHSVINVVDENILLRDLFLKLNWEKELAVEYGVGLFFMFSSMIGFSFAISYLFKSIFLAPDRFIDAVRIFALIGLPPFFKYYSHIYDFSSLFLFTVGLAFLYRKKWKAMMFLFAIACFNKETIILLTFLFVIHYYDCKRIETQLFVKLLFLQIGIFILSRVILSFLFMDNAGGVIEYHLIGHNTGLIHSYSFETLAAVLFLFLLVAYRWNEKPRFLKNGLWIILPLFSLTLFFGLLDELRDYYEAYPIVLILISVSIARLIGIQVSERAISE